jgi:hypothetical protein
MAKMTAKKPSPPRLVRAFEAAVRPFTGTTQRKMFGYPAIFLRGNMVAGLVRDRMILRLSDRDRERFLALEGAEPFIRAGRCASGPSFPPRWPRRGSGSGRGSAGP